MGTRKKQQGGSKRDETETSACVKERNREGKRARERESISLVEQRYQKEKYSKTENENGGKVLSPVEEVVM